MFKEKDYWLAVSCFFKFGPKRFSLLLKRFGSAKNVWRVKDTEIQKLALGEKVTTQFLSFRRTFDIKAYLNRVANQDVLTIASFEKDYPSLLLEISDPPLVLYIKSKLKPEKIFQNQAIAIVGTRNITEYGRIVTRKITSGLVENKVTIVSGLARGVDILSHRVAVYNKGLTIAVLGSGIDHIYPPEHQRDSQAISENGAVISEFPLGTRAHPSNFPIRNRIISGLSLGVVVTEAAKKSGAMLTVAYAAEQGREVFVVPGPITSYFSEGTNELIKKGAKATTTVEDILEEFPQIVEEGKTIKPERNLSKEETTLLAIIKRGPQTIDELVRTSKYPIQLALSSLSLLELKGLVRKEGEVVYGMI